MHRLIKGNNYKAKTRTRHKLYFCAIIKYIPHAQCFLADDNDCQIFYSTLCLLLCKPSWARRTAQGKSVLSVYSYVGVQKNKLFPLCLETCQKQHKFFRKPVIKLNTFAANWNTKIYVLFLMYFKAETMTLSSIFKFFILHGEI